MFMKACRKCNYIFEEGDVCPVCGSDDITEKFGGRIYLLDPDNSEIAKLINAKVKGTYAVRVK
ncbi:DNA-directed RNA polymerase, subunit E'' [Candidatus Micrarchaeota archaeon]|nr:DNA-directed RNA polymerase, subunit E'' [Candidatus Micrarchaeota archaeon]